MSSSKVLRGRDSRDLKPIRLVEFGENGEVLADMPEEIFEESPHSSSPPQREEADPGLVEQKIEEAFSRGRQEGGKESEQRFGKTIEALAQGLEEISRLRESLLSNGSQDMLCLVLAIAKQVIQTELSVNSEVILSTIEKALHAAVRSDTYHIKINPEDLALVTEKKPLFLARISGLKNLTFEADAAIARGGCKLESELGEVEATIESQLEVIRQTLESAVEGL